MIHAEIRSGTKLHWTWRVQWSLYCGHTSTQEWVVIQMMTLLLPSIKSILHAMELMPPPHPPPPPPPPISYPDPTSHKEKIWWLLNDFLVVLSQQYWFWTNIDYMLRWCDTISLVQKSNSAQPRNSSIVTRPFSLWEVGSGDKSSLLTSPYYDFIPMNGSLHETLLWFTIITQLSIGTFLAYSTAG